MKNTNKLQASSNTNGPKKSVSAASKKKALQAEKKALALLLQAEPPPAQRELCEQCGEEIDDAGDGRRMWRARSVSHTCRLQTN